MNESGITGRSSEDRVTLGLAGIGRWGSCYLSTLADMNGVDLGLVVSRNPETRGKVPRHCDVVEDWQNALDPARIDGLILATPQELHYEMVRACIDAGMPVLVEKPLTMNPGQAAELARAAGENDTLVMVDHTHVFSSAYETLKQRACLLEGPKQFHSAGGNHGPFRKSTDALWDWGPHDVAMCIDLAGEPPQSIHAEISAIRHASEGGGMVIDVRMAFANGIEAHARFGNLMSEKKRVFEVRTESGGLIYDDMAEDKLVEYGHEGTEKRVAISSTLPLTRVVSAFRDHIVSGSHQHESLPLGVRVVETLARIESELKANAGPEHEDASLAESIRAGNGIGSGRRL